MKKFFYFLLVLTVCGFALIGLGTVGVYVGMQHGLLNVPGSIIERNAFFGRVPAYVTTDAGDEIAIAEATNGCKPPLSQTTPCEWNETIYWDTVKGGLEKDAVVIQRVATETGVDARIIAATVVPEQTRFFTDNRDVFKRYFEPLKLLGSMSQFSLGVTGIKQETARQIEEYARSTSSEFYPGDTVAPLLAYTDAEQTDTDAALFARLTNEKDHYYSYLYTAIYLKQITAQWQKAGYDVQHRPDVLVTLFNIGFAASVPKANPQVAGSRVTNGGQSYSFGYLGTLFYQSDELTDLFPATHSN
jgi:hypothetical protein